jgi:hypothetical protein
MSSSHQHDVFAPATVGSVACEGLRKSSPRRYSDAMARRATRDEILDQIRRMSLEDRDYIEAELLRDGYEASRRAEDPELTAELVRRANESRARPDGGVSREEAVARARAAVEAVRARNKS